MKIRLYFNNFDGFLEAVFVVPISGGKSNAERHYLNGNLSLNCLIVEQEEGVVPLRK